MSGTVAPTIAGRKAASDALLLNPAASSLAGQAMEDAAIWSKLWVCVGYAAEIPHPGDVLPFTVGDHGIHIERQADGSLAGRFNKAQHGGCRAVPLQCRTGAKTRCSFTACGHSRDRRPLRALDEADALHLDQYLGQRPERLLPVAVAAWGPLLLVRLDPGEGSACDWPSPASILGANSVEVQDETIWRELAGDWKTVALRLARPIALRGEAGTCLFPNVVVRRSGAHAVIAILQPVALERTLCRFRVYRDASSPTVENASAAVVDALVREVDCPEAESRSLATRDEIFETAMATALATLVPDAARSFFRTDEKDRW